MGCCGSAEVKPQEGAKNDNKGPNANANEKAKENAAEKAK